MSPGSVTLNGLNTVPRFIMACLAALALLVLTPAFAHASLEELLQTNAKLITKSSSKTVGPVLDELQQYGGAQAETFLTNWQAKKLYFIKQTGQFVLAEKAPKSADGKKQMLIRDAVTEVEIGLADQAEQRRAIKNRGHAGAVSAWQPGPGHPRDNAENASSRYPAVASDPVESRDHGGNSTGAEGADGKGLCVRHAGPWQ